MSPDPETLARYALEGRVVTMNAGFDILDRGMVYVDGERIVAVQPTGAPAPPGMNGVEIIRTGGTIYPGLIELHNHLSYNVLQLLPISRRYRNRSEWGGREAAYRQLVSGPMTVLGRTRGYVQAVVRYVECKCLVSGVTTSQGIALFSNQGITKYYRGNVRNVEQPLDPDLPRADTRIADVEAENVDRFFDRLRRSSCLLLHLSEGTDEKARQRFTDLRLPDGSWAITPALAGIHALALRAEDFETLARHGASMVWSPMSNLLLYGDTADIAAARASGIRIGLGSDWSVSGSKNLLGELKAARLASDAQGGVFSERELVTMVTRNAAEILKWGHALGSIEPGKRADLLVIAGRQGDPYATLIQARETGVTLVTIDGVPLYGNQRLMSRFRVETEQVRVGGTSRLLNLDRDHPDPAVGPLTLAAATERLRDGMQRLPELARNLEVEIEEALESDEEQWFLLLAEEEPEGIALRPRLSPEWVALEDARRLLVDAESLAIPLSEVLVPLPLDALTVRDDRTYFDRLSRQPNLPDAVKEGLPGLS
jgi:5-methylthioadenosine/S-adenosylhomocysteine deaminase